MKTSRGFEARPGGVPVIDGAANQPRGGVGRQRIAVGALVGLLLSGLAAWVSPAPVAASQPLGQFLWWTDQGDGYRQFGANAAVTIHTGEMGFVNSCPVPGENDFLFPWTDIYIVRTGSIFDGVVLNPLSVVFPKTVQATGSSGLFVDETIGFTYPTGAMLQEGEYAVVFDECQDGIFQAGTDAVFDPAFRVEIGDTSVPLLPLDLADMKAEAFAQAASYARLNVFMNVLAMATIPSPSRWQTSLGIITSLTGLFLDDPVAVLSTHLRNMVRHYLALAQDPPDPAFEQPTSVVNPLPGVEPRDGTDALAAAAALATEAGSEAALIEAFVHSLERYQGAGADSDGTWALAHARALSDTARQVDLQLARTADTLDALADEVGAMEADLTGAASAMTELRDRLVANNLTSEELLLVRSLGLEGDLQSLLDELVDMDLDAFDAATAAADLRQAADDSRANRSTWLSFAVAMDGIAGTLEGDPTVEDLVPEAQPGGPYAGVAGTPLALAGGGTSGGPPIVGYAWDLDLDGDFDDATGAAPTVTFDAARAGVIGLRVSDDDGRHGVAYAPILVTWPGSPPQIDTRSPLTDPVEVLVGASQAFGLSVSDPDGPAPTVEWRLDGAVVETGVAYQLDTTAADLGTHVVEAIADDGSRRRVTSWAVGVRAPDGDGDGWPSNLDCADGDADVSPGATEIALNGIDDDCDPGTSDDGLGPTAAFVSSAPAGGRNVALRDVGPFSSTPSAASATVMAESPPYASNWAMSTALDIDAADTSWAAGPAAVRYGVVRLWGTSPWLVDRIAIMPRVDYQPQRVRDFAVDVATTGFANESDWTTVLTATAADSGTLQAFALPDGPVAARYVRVRLLSNRGDPSYISVSQFKVYATQQSGGTSFDFEDRSSDPESDIVARSWDFGDGTTSTDADPSHTYAAPGAYTVSLTVTDSRGHTSSTSLPYRVLTPPTATVPVFPTINEKTEIHTAGYGAADADGERIVRMVWNWGDGSQTVASSGAFLFHLYHQDGTYTVRLTVTDAQEQTGFSERTVTVLNVPPSATLPNRTVMGGVPSTFSGSPSDPADILSCTWDFGDGSATAAGCAPQAHAYPAPAAGSPDVQYTQTFRATDDRVTVTRTATITVTSRLPDRTVTDGLAFTYQPPSFLADVQNPKTCSWDFGDGSSPVAGCGAPVHAYPALAPGAADATYPLRISVTSGGSGAALLGSVTVTGSPSPVVYSTDFESGASAEWSGITATESVQLYAGHGFAGRFLRNPNAPSPTTLTLTDLPAHDGISLTFLLAIIDSWDGGTTCGAGPDTFNVRIDGVLYFSRIFENSGCGIQTYVPPPHVELARHQHLGFGVGTFFGDSAYNMGLDPLFRSIPHTNDSLTIEFFQTTVGANDESWAIDNLEVALLGVTGSAPIAEAGGPYTTSEGTLVVLDGAASSDEDGPLTYAWDLDNDGEFDDAISATAAITPDDGPTSFVVGLRVTDSDGETATDVATVEVFNVAPTAVLSAPANVLEGERYAVSLGTAVDPSTADSGSLAFAFDCGLGAGYGGFGAATSTTCTAGDDDLAAAVRAMVRDKDGDVTEYLATVPVVNGPPSGTFEATDTIDEGGIATLRWSSATDPSATDAALLRYGFTCDEALGLPESSWALASVDPETTCTYLDDGSIGVQGRVLDPDDASQTTGAVVTVRNVAPTATLSAPVSADEGGSFTLALVGPADPSPVDTAAGFRYAFDCGDGAGFGDWSGVPSVICPALPNDGQQAVSARISDKDGGVRPYAAVVTILNLAPTVGLSNDGPTAWGLPVWLTATADDPSPSDAAALTYAWDLDGDGTFETGPSSNASQATTYSSPGSVTARVRVCDERDCAEATSHVSVTRRGATLVDETTGPVQYSDHVLVAALLEDAVTPGPVGGRSILLSAGSLDETATTGADGRAEMPIPVGLPSGSTLVTGASFAGDAHYLPASAGGSVAVVAEDAELEYSGDTFATGTVARLAATVAEAADGSLGDITMASVTFDVYVGATTCGSGTPARHGPIAVVDTGTLGDGIGTAEYELATPAEQTYCIVARLTGAGQTSANPYYAALPAQGAVLTIVSTTGKFATGGGWIVDPLTGGHGNFGFTARFMKNGAPKGQAVYVWRATVGGVLTDFIVKSSSISAMSFADHDGTGTFPWRATLSGRATIRAARASNGTELWSDGNATFTLIAVDSGESSGRGVDSFALRVLDKTGATYRLVGSWSDSSWSAGVPLSGGNVVVHLE